MRRELRKGGAFEADGKAAAQFGQVEVLAVSRSHHGQASQRTLTGLGLKDFFQLGRALQTLKPVALPFCVLQSASGITIAASPEFSERLILAFAT